MRIHCNKCGKEVSSDVPDNTILRGWVECPECIIKDNDVKPLTEEQYSLLMGFAHDLISNTYSDDITDQIQMAVQDTMKECGEKLRDLIDNNLK